MATNYVVSNRQLTAAVLAVAILVGTGSAAAVTALKFLDLPLVEQDPSGKCIRVVNYKNGDGYACQDVDVLLRHYRTKAFIFVNTTSAN